VTFDRLFAVLVVGHGRRQLLWFEVTRRPSGWPVRSPRRSPGHLVRDNDRAYGHVFTARVRAMGIRDRPICPGRDAGTPGISRPSAQGDRGSSAFSLGDSRFAMSRSVIIPIKWSFSPTGRTCKKKLGRSRPKVN
jgi:hypothetical protein